MDLLWDDVRMLDAIETEGSVPAAARALRVSVSTVYRRIAALEAGIGAPCISRTPGPVALTDAGRTLAEAGRTSRRAIARATSELRARETALEGEVSLTTVEALAPFVVAPIAEVHRAHGVRVSLHLGDRGPSVRDREVDVAVGIMRRPPPGCWGRRIARLPYAVFGTREVVQASAPPWVTRSAELDHTPEATWERAHATPVAARAPFTALVLLAAAGVGLGLMPRAIAAQHRTLVAHETVHAIRLERSVWILTHADLRKRPRVSALMDALARSFAEID